MSSRDRLSVTRKHTLPVAGADRYCPLGAGAISRPHESLILADLFCLLEFEEPFCCVTAQNKRLTPPLGDVGGTSQHAGFLCCFVSTCWDG